MREKVLAAAELFADRGLDATKMEDIASVTGVPKATLYYYFEGKEAILAFLFGEVLDEVQRAVEGALATAGTAADRLRALVVAHLGVFESRPAASRALQLDLGRAARLPLINDRTHNAFVGPVAHLLKAGGIDGSLRTQRHPRIAAVAILGAITTVGINAVAVDLGRPVDEVAEDILAVLLEGVGA